MPTLGFGCSDPRDETEQAVATALEVRYRHIDTAASHGNDDESLGELGSLAARRPGKWGSEGDHSPSPASSSSDRSGPPMRSPIPAVSNASRTGPCPFTMNSWEAHGSERRATRSSVWSPHRSIDTSAPRSRTNAPPSRSTALSSPSNSRTLEWSRAPAKHSRSIPLRRLRVMANPRSGALPGFSTLTPVDRPLRPVDRERAFSDQDLGFGVGSRLLELPVRDGSILRRIVIGGRRVRNDKNALVTRSVDPTCAVRSASAVDEHPRRVV